MTRLFLMRAFVRALYRRFAIERRIFDRGAMFS